MEHSTKAMSKKIVPTQSTLFCNEYILQYSEHGNCVKPYDPHTIGQSYYQKNMLFPL